MNEHDATELRIDALSEQIKAACKASGLEVIGFTFLTLNGDGMTTTSNARVPYDTYMKALATYLKAEADDPTPFS